MTSAHWQLVLHCSKQVQHREIAEISRKQVRKLDTFD